MKETEHISPSQTVHRQLLNLEAMEVNTSLRMCSKVTYHNVQEIDCSSFPFLGFQCMLITGYVYLHSLAGNQSYSKFMILQVHKKSFTESSVYSCEPRKIAIHQILAVLEKTEAVDIAHIAHQVDGPGLDASRASVPLLWFVYTAQHRDREIKWIVAS